MPSTSFSGADPDQVANQPLRQRLVAVVEIARVDALAEAEAGQEIAGRSARGSCRLSSKAKARITLSACRQQVDILFEAGQPLIGAREGIFDLDERRAVAGDHHIDRQASQHVERFARRLQAAGIFRMAEQFREDDPEAVAPQGIAGDQQASLGVVEGKRVHVVAGNRERPPVEAAELDFIAGGDRRIMAKARRRLAERREQQGLFVPLGNRRVDALRNNDLAAERPRSPPRCRRYGRNASGCSAAGQPTTGQRVFEQGDRLGGVRDVAAVDQAACSPSRKTILFDDSQPRSRTSRLSGSIRPDLAGRCRARLSACRRDWHRGAAPRRRFPA
jgi:hypothetical protein